MSLEYMQMTYFFQCHDYLENVTGQIVLNY